MIGFYHTLETKLKSFNGRYTILPEMKLFTLSISGINVILNLEPGEAFFCLKSCTMHVIPADAHFDTLRCLRDATQNIRREMLTPVSYTHLSRTTPPNA